MKPLAFLLISLFSINAFPNDVYVDGYTRPDGTYVAPHVRSAPDSYKFNNYGDPAPGNIQQQQDVRGRDYDRDRTMNQFDYDDDNDGLMDEYEKF